MTSSKQWTVGPRKRIGAPLAIAIMVAGGIPAFGGCAGNLTQDDDDIALSIVADDRSATAGVASFDAVYSRKHDTWTVGVLDAQGVELARLTLPQRTRADAVTPSGSLASVVQEDTTTSEGETKRVTLAGDGTSIDIISEEGTNGDLRVRLESQALPPLEVLSVRDGTPTSPDEHYIKGWLTGVGYYTIEQASAMKYMTVALTDENLSSQIQIIERRPIIEGGLLGLGRNTEDIHTSAACSGFITAITGGAAGIACGICGAALLAKTVTVTLSCIVGIPSCIWCMISAGITVTQAVPCLISYMRRTRDCSNYTCNRGDVPRINSNEHGCHCECDIATCSNVCQRDFGAEWTGACDHGPSCECVKIGAEPRAPLPPANPPPKRASQSGCANGGPTFACDDSTDGEGYSDCTTAVAAAADALDPSACSPPPSGCGTSGTSVAGIGCPPVAAAPVVSAE